MSPKVYLICGKLCCGKTTYARQLQKEHSAVLLSVDEIMLAVFGLYAGEKHDTYTASLRSYLLAKSLEILQAGTSVILDWGFWTRTARAEAREFYQSRGIDCQLHYLDLANEEWMSRVARRNQAVEDCQEIAYPVDENLLAKFNALFEPPTPEEIDVCIS